MKTIAFISGKGGTGKTSLVASFARLAAPVCVVDCDVDAANAAILMPPVEILRRELFVSGQRAVIAQEACVGCAMCLDECRFGAIAIKDDVFSIDKMSCEGCGVCKLVCASEAVEMVPNEAGSIQVLETREGVLVHGELEPAQSNSGKLVTRVRELGVDIANDAGCDFLLLDGPPGVGCPVHATLAGTDLVVIVTEPTLSGEHDLERALDLIQHFHLQGCAIINKADLSDELTNRIIERSLSRSVPVLGKIPFLLQAPKELARRRSLIDIEALRPRLEQIWRGIVVAAMDSEVIELPQVRESEAGRFG